ncbi:class II fructose-bisphosphate aldolase [Salmonella enterica subsp. enterica]|nr:class II fructose-bisphosphate aldolase [Salmonella enterica subsp. enterica]
MYTSEPKLNFEVVERVRRAVSVPLVLHGAPVLATRICQKAISLGIRKSISTELCQAAMVAVKRIRSAVSASGTRSTQSGKSPRTGKIKLFGSDGKAE